jgi:hypothetical protein
LPTAKPPQPEASAPEPVFIQSKEPSLMSKLQAPHKEASEQSLLPLNLGKRSQLARTALHSSCQCNVFASIQFTEAIKIKEIDMECPGCLVRL